MRSINLLPSFHNRKDSIVDLEDGVSLYKFSDADQKEFFEI